MGNHPCSRRKPTPRPIAIAIGFAIAIETSWLSLSAGDACLRAPHRLAQAGTGREHEIQKNDFDRIPAMSTRLGGRGYLVQEDGLPSNREWIDSDSDPDSEKNESSSSDGSLPCQIHPIARLSFRGSSTSVVSLSRNLQSIFSFALRSVVRDIRAEQLGMDR